MFFLDNDSPAFPGLLSFDDDVLQFNEGSGSFFDLTRDGGGAFDLLSVKVGTLGRDDDDDGNFTFTGTLFGGGTIETTLFATAVPTTFNFAGFTNLISVAVTSTDGFFPVMDDLTVSPAEGTPGIAVPDGGSTFLLMAMALTTFGAVRRKRRIV